MSVLVKLAWELGLPSSLAGAAGRRRAQLGTANKNFIGIVEGEQRTADQSTSNLRLNEIGVPWLFHPCSRSICQACAAVASAVATLLVRRGAPRGLFGLPYWPPDLAHTANKKRLIKGPDFNQVSRCTAHSPSQSM